MNAITTLKITPRWQEIAGRVRRLGKTHRMVSRVVESQAASLKITNLSPKEK